MVLWQWKAIINADMLADWRQEEKGTTEDAMVGWHHWLNGQAPGDGEGQGRLACWSPWGHKEWGTTGLLNHHMPGAGSGVKNPPAVQELQEMWARPWVGKTPRRRKWQPTSVFLPGKSHRLTGYSPWGPKESDTTEATKHVYTRAVHRWVFKALWSSLFPL